MFEKILSTLNLLSSPASKKQAAYKTEAKAKNLLSIQELTTKLAEGNDLEELQKDSDFRLVADSVKLDSNILKQADENGKVKLSNVVVFTEKNFHNLHITEDGYKYLEANQKDYVKSYPEFSVLNANHQGAYPENCFGEYEIISASYKDGELRADIELDINHPAFASQKYSLEQDPDLQLGFSIEIAAADGGFAYEKETKALLYSKPILVGLATTLVPSAPGTLMNLDNANNNQNLAIAEPVESEDMVEAGDTVLNADKELMWVATLIRDTSFKYKDLISTEADPIALLYNPCYWSWEDGDAYAYNFANVSTLTKVKYNYEANQLTKLNDKFKNELNHLKTEYKLNIPDEPVESDEQTDDNSDSQDSQNTDEVNKLDISTIINNELQLAITKLENEYNEKLNKVTQELTVKFDGQVDEITKTFQSQLNQANSDTSTLANTVITTLNNYNTTLEAQNKSITRLEQLNKPKSITSL